MVNTEGDPSIAAVQSAAPPIVPPKRDVVKDAPKTEPLEMYEEPKKTFKDHFAAPVNWFKSRFGSNESKDKTEASHNSQVGQGAWREQSDSEEESGDGYNSLDAYPTSRQQAIAQLGRAAGDNTSRGRVAVDRDDLQQVASGIVRRRRKTKHKKATDTNNMSNLIRRSMSQQLIYNESLNASDVDLPDREPHPHLHNHHYQQRHNQHRFQDKTTKRHFVSKNWLAMLPAAGNNARKKASSKLNYLDKKCSNLCSSSASGKKGVSGCSSHECGRSHGNDKDIGPGANFKSRAKVNEQINKCTVFIPHSLDDSRKRSSHSLTGPVNANEVNSVNGNDNAAVAVTTDDQAVGANKAPVWGRDSQQASAQKTLQKGRSAPLWTYDPHYQSAGVGGRQQGGEAFDLRQAGLIDLRQGEKLTVHGVYMEQRLLVKNELGQFGLVRLSEVNISEDLLAKLPGEILCKQ